jgi:hypothetical protein
MVITAIGLGAWRRHRSIAAPVAVPVHDEQSDPESASQADQGAV